MKKPRIFLTGGHGMVGKNILEHPRAKDWDFVVPTHQALNLTDFEAIRRFIDDVRPDTIIHAAGKVGGIQANLREPVNFLMDNLDMGRNVVWAAHQAGIKRLINLGSSCMYPRNHSGPLREEMVLQGELEPSNEGYALAKIVTARLCEYVMREDANYKYKTLIPCNIYGRHDKFDPAHSHLVPAIIHKIHQAKVCGQAAVEIWGDGKARREFMYAGDLADAIINALDKIDSLPDYMNVGLGQDHTIDDYYQAAAAVMDYRGEFIHNRNKPVGMARKLVSIDRQRAWNWSAKHDLRSGLEKTYNFYLKECA